MADEIPDYFEPEGGAVLTHLLIVRGIGRPREFYRRYRPQLFAKINRR